MVDVVLQLPSMSNMLFEQRSKDGSALHVSELSQPVQVYAYGLCI